MRNNLKVLGVAMVAMLAMSAVWVSAASADVFKTEHGASPVTITAKQTTTNVFAIPEGNTSCKVVTLTATGAVNNSTAVTGIVPHITECTSFGFPAVVHFNGCTLTLRINAGAGVTTGTVDLVCPAGKEITITAVIAGTTKGTTHIEPQTGLGTVTYSNVGAGTTKEITANLNLANVKYRTTAGTGAGACPTTATTAGATLKGSALVTAELPGTNTHEGIFVS